MIEEEDKIMDRSNLVKVITSPLGFFALSLLTVEGFLTIAMVFSNIEPANKVMGMMIGAGLFLIVVVIVFALVWCKPTNLTFGEKSHLKHEENVKNWGTSDKPETRRNLYLNRPTRYIYKTITPPTK